MAEISGLVQIKRKLFWVMRYAEIVNGQLLYYHEKGDTLPRGVFQLTGSSVIEQIVSESEFILIFTANTSQACQRIIFRFSDHKEQRRWLRRLLGGQSPATIAAAAAAAGVTQNNLNSTLLPATNPNVFSESNMKGINNTKQQLPERKEQETRGAQSAQNSQETVTQPQQQQDLLDDQSRLGSMQSERINGGNPWQQQARNLIDDSLITLKGGAAKQLIEQISQLKASRFEQSSLLLVDAKDQLRVFSQAQSLSTACLAMLPRVVLQDIKGFAQSIRKSSNLKAIFSTMVVIASILLYQLAWTFNLSWLSFFWALLISSIFLPSLSLAVQGFFTVAENIRSQSLNCLATGIVSIELNAFLNVLAKEFAQRNQYEVGVSACSRVADASGNQQMKSQRLKLIHANRGTQSEVLQDICLDSMNVYLVESIVQEAEDKDNNNYSTGNSSSTVIFKRIFEISIENIYPSHFIVNYYFAGSAPTFSDSSKLLPGIISYLETKANFNNFGILSSIRFSSPLENLSSIDQQEYSQQQQQQSRGRPQMYGNQSGNVQQQIKHQYISQNSPQFILDVDENKEEKGIILSELSAGATNAAPSKQISSLVEDGQTNTREVQSGVETAVSSSGSLIQSDPFQLTGENAAKYSGLLREKMELIKKLAPLSAENQWVLDKEKGDFKSHTRLDQSSGILMSRGEVTVKKSMQAAIELLKDTRTRKKWDDLFKESSEIVKLSENTSIEHTMFNGILMVSGRDMVILQSNFTVDGVFFYIGTSTTHPNVPEGKKFVRADLKVGGWVMTPVNNGAHCNCVYITCCDPCGKISSSIKEIGAKMQTQNAMRFKKLLEELK